MTDILTIEGIQKDDSALWDALEQIPQGHSEFQIRNFIAKQPGPALSYKLLLMQVQKEYDALVYNQCERGKSEVQIRRKRRQIVKKQKEMVGENEELQDDIEELEWECKQLEHQFRKQDILVKDSLERVRIYLEELSKLPTFTRKELEKQFEHDWRKKKINEVELQIAAGRSPDVGDLHSLMQMGMNPIKALHDIRAGVVGVQKQLCEVENSVESEHGSAETVQRESV